MKTYKIHVLLIVFLALTACAPALNTEEEPPEPIVTKTADAPVLTWERTGGIAGFCDTVIIYPDGSADVSNCKGDVKVRIQLTQGQRVKMEGWLSILKPIEFTQSDPAVADNMTISLSLAGKGSQMADEEIIRLISEFAADIAYQVELDRNLPPEKELAEQVLREYLSALNQGDYILGAKHYGGDTEILRTWNPDIPDDLPALFERACTQNGLVCMNPLSIAYRGVDEFGNQLFQVEFSNPDGSLFQQGPCCGEEEGPIITTFLFRVQKTEVGYVVLDLPPYVP